MKEFCLELTLADICLYIIGPLQVLQKKQWVNFFCCHFRLQITMNTITEESSLDNSSSVVNCSVSRDYGVSRKRIRVDDTRNEDISELNESSVTNVTQDCSSDIDISRMCAADQPAESTRMSTTNNESSLNQSYLDRSCFNTVLFEDDEQDKVSVMSRVVNLVFSISYDFKKMLGMGGAGQSADSMDETVMRTVCNMKALRLLASTLQSVHEAVGLRQLRMLSLAFKEEVDRAWRCVKKFVQHDIRNKSNNEMFQNTMYRLLEISGALSLASVDNVAKGEGRLYVAEQFEGDLSVYFVDHQNRFLITMLNKVGTAVNNGIEDTKKLQLSTDHEMAADIVDGVMNVLTSMKTLLEQCDNLLLTYLGSVQRCSGRFYADECFHLRSILTDINDYNENIALLIRKSKLVAKSSDALEEFVDVPVLLADITKSICSSVGDLVTYTMARKELEDPIVDTLLEARETFLFAGKTVRVGVSVLIQEIEKDMNIEEDCSIVQMVRSDKAVAKRGSLCPLNASNIVVESSVPKTMTNKGKDRRSSCVRSEQYVSRYMDMSDFSS